MWLYFIFEGDDSLGLTEGLKEYAQDIEDIWSRHGFNMKLVWVNPGQAATVVGWNVYVDEEGPVASEMVPEPIRGLISSAWSTSAALKAEVSTLDQGSNARHEQSTNILYHQVACSSYLARYHSNAGRFPELASYYRACAMHHKARFTMVDRETSMKVYGAERTVSAATLLEEADTRASEIQPAGKVLKALGLTLSPEESAAFMALENLGLDDHRARLVVPSRWLK